MVLSSFVLLYLQLLVGFVGSSFDALDFLLVVVLVCPGSVVDPDGWVLLRLADEGRDVIVPEERPNLVDQRAHGWARAVASRYFGNGGR